MVFLSNMKVKGESLVKNKYPLCYSVSTINSSVLCVIKVLIFFISYITIDVDVDQPCFQQFGSSPLPSGVASSEEAHCSNHFIQVCKLN